MTDEAQVMFDLIKHLGVHDSICCFIGKQRADHTDEVERMVEQLARTRPWATIVGSETSDAERASLNAAQMTGLRHVVIPSARRGQWDAGPDIRDERIVSACTDIFLMDDTSRAKDVAKLAKRMVGKRVWRMH